MSYNNLLRDNLICTYSYIKPLVNTSLTLQGVFTQVGVH